LACLALGNSTTYATPQPISNDKELSVALKNAKTPDDHRLIAAHHEEKARKLQQKEKEELDMAEHFATHPSMYGKIYPTPFQNHKNLADYSRCAASIELEKAEEHRATAESLAPASNAPEAPRRNVRPQADDAGLQVTIEFAPAEGIIEVRGDCHSAKLS